MRCQTCRGTGEICPGCGEPDHYCDCFEPKPDLEECPACGGEGEEDGDGDTCEDCSGLLDDDGFCPDCDEDDDSEDDDDSDTGWIL